MIVDLDGVIFKVELADIETAAEQDGGSDWGSKDVASEIIDGG